MSHSIVDLPSRQTSGDDMEEFIAESRDTFLEWAQSHVIPLDDDNDEDGLEAIASAIGNARVVALSEGCHNSREMMRLHFRLVRHLVEKHNFTTVVTESGLPESRLIFDYVNGAELAEEDAGEEMYRKGLNKMYGAWKEGREMVEWMRDCNHQHNDEEKSLQYYGIDIGGFYQDWKTPLKKVVSYLQRNVFTADEAFALMKLTKRLQPFLDAMHVEARVHYTDRMTAQERNVLAESLGEAVEHFQTFESEYVDRSGRVEYEWARQSLISMQLAENYYRNYMDRCNPESSKFVGLNGRELAMHRNILWVMKQRPSSKIIWINHVAHTKTATQYQGEMWGFLSPAGALIQESLGSDLFTIGLVYGGGEYWKDWQKGLEHRTVAPVPDPRENGLERTLGSLVKTSEAQQKLFIPWAKAPVGAWPWLQKDCSIRENDYFLKIKPSEWNACVYIDTISPSTPAGSIFE
jgi:erythromycin esterase